MLNFSNIMVFLVVLIIYLHVFYNLRVNNDLDVLFLDDIRHYVLSEIMKIKQPVVFSENKNVPWFKKSEPTKENVLKSRVETNDIQQAQTKQVIKTDNRLLIEYETVIKKLHKMCKIPFYISRDIKVWSGGSNTFGKIQQFRDTINIMYVVRGSVKVMVSTPDSSVWFDETSDNPWEQKNQHCWREINIDSSQILVIPPYWWFFIKFDDDVGADIIVLNYATISSKIYDLMNLFYDILYYIFEVLKNSNFKELTKELPWNICRVI